MKNKIVNNIVYDDKTAPYKKKSKKRTPKKANHKHEFADCIFEYDGLRLDDAHGFQPQPREWFGKYCRICGKIGGLEYEKWVKQHHKLRIDGTGIARDLTDKAASELNPETRTLPTFRVDDIYGQKYIKL